MSTVGCPKAKIAANQSLVESLYIKRNSLPPPQPGRRNHFAHNLKNAEDSIRKLKEPIASYTQALVVKGVGPKIAHILFPDGEEECEAATAKRKQSRAAAAMQDSPASSAASSSSAASKRRRKEANSTATSGSSNNGSAKVRAYEKAVADALTWKSQSRSLVWKVVLIVDEREREKTHMESKCLMAKIPCERRTLPIGDMAWIAQAFHNYDRTEKKPVVELMLGTIIERKSLSDLISSIKGSRYVEQRMRMKESGLPQLLFLVEGDLHKDARNTQEFKMCYTAMYETRVHLGFQIVQTANMTETVQTLKRLHRRILKRTFPSAFYAEALPFFSGPDLDHRRQSLPPSSSQQSSSAGSNREHVQASRRRRKNDSLQEMRFDVEPVPFGDMDRFITYPEFKAKVEMGRENASRSVAMIHAAMLKQVPRIENKKIQVIMNAYPTPRSLYSAYDELDTVQAKKELVSALPLSDETSATRRFVGPQSSDSLYMAYGMTKDASRRLSYDDLTQQVRSSQESAANDSRPCSQVSQPAMSQHSQSNADQHASTKTTRQKRNSAVEEVALKSDTDVHSQPIDEPGRGPVECIDLLSSDDEMSKKTAARSSPISSRAPSQAYEAAKTLVNPLPSSLSEEEWSDFENSSTKPCAKKQAPPKQEEASAAINHLLATANDDDDIGSDYDYSPPKHSAKEGSRSQSVESAMKSLFPDDPLDLSDTRAHATLDAQPSFLDSSSYEDDDDILGSAYKKKRLKTTLFGSSVPSSSSEPTNLSRKEDMSNSGILHLGDSSSDEDGDENAAPMNNKNQVMDTKSITARKKKDASPEIIDLIDDD